MARRRNLLAPWSLFVRQNIHSTRGIDDDVDDVDDEYGNEFDLDDKNESVERVTTSVNMVTSRPENRSSLLSRLCERSFVKKLHVPNVLFLQPLLIKISKHI